MQDITSGNLEDVVYGGTNLKVNSPYIHDRLTVHENLAMIYYRRGNYSLAKAQFLRTFKLQQEVLGKGHPDTIATLDALANIYFDEGKDWNEAEYYYKECLHLRQTKLGPHHPDSIGCLSNLAYLYQQEKRFDEAECLYASYLQLHRKHHIQWCKNSLNILNNLAFCIMIRES